MMDSSQPIPRISPKSRVKIPVVRGRGGRRGGRGGRGVSRTMHQESRVKIPIFLFI
ncbi:hypothetical protein Scep_009626 [Stephania cephalantha]|uniref:Uncharacterized protein n=1 Tax=Stephania cephalantha TaxID=152367 RepID=A0AAP0PGD1_9MAGN